MSGSLVQLSAIGAQDSYLLLDPEITFFSQKSKRHTPFAVEPQAVKFNQPTKTGNSSIVQIPRVADLLHKIWIKVTLPALNPNGKYPGARYCDEVAYALIDKIELKIGQHVIDTHFGHFLQVWSQLNTPEEKRYLDHLVGKTGGDLTQLENNAKFEQTLWIPMDFWFNRSIGNALPIAGLQFHTVQFDIRFNKMDDIVANWGIGNPEGDKTTKTELELNGELMCHYIYLDDAERNWFGTAPQEYLIDQLWYSQDVSIPANTDPSTFVQNMTLNHPCKELIWTITTAASIAAKEPFNYSANSKAYNAAGDPMISMSLKFNELPRLPEMDAVYYRLIQPSLHHTSIPTKHVYCYSFALDPESWKPSGSINMSRIDQVKMTLKTVGFKEVHHEYLPAVNGNPGTKDGATLRVYARVVNIFKVMSGMAGIQYCN